MKSGFYHIALNAQIPIVRFTFDYDHQIIRCLAMLQSSGNYPTDLAKILSRYEGQFSPKIASRLAKPLQKLFKKR